MNEINMKWVKVPKDIRRKILNNVWCVKCKDVIEVIDYKINEDDVGLAIW